MDNKFVRFCIVEPKCKLRLAILFVLVALIISQFWYSKAQAKQLTEYQMKETLIARITDMEKELKTKAQLEAFRNDSDGELGNVSFSKISGIAMKAGTPSVLIDSTVYSEGDSFGEYVIVKITSKQITLVNKRTNAIKNLYVF